MLQRTFRLLEEFGSDGLLECDRCGHRGLLGEVVDVDPTGTHYVVCLDVSACDLRIAGPHAPLVGAMVAATLRDLGPLQMGAAVSLARCKGICARTVPVDTLEDGVCWFCRTRNGRE